MKQICVPIGLVVGDSDPVISPPLLMETIIAPLPDTPLTVVLNAGHLLPLTNPGAVVALIRETLARYTA